MDNIIVRTAVLADINNLLALEQEVVEAERPYNKNIKANGAVYYDIEHLINDSGSSMVVAQVGEEIIGTGYAQIRQSKKSLNHDYHAYLGFMYVSPEMRGQGINRLIMDTLINWSKEQGIFDFSLDVYDGNDAAIKAYQKAGFENSLVEMTLNLPRPKK